MNHQKPHTCALILTGSLCPQCEPLTSSHGSTADRYYTAANLLIIHL